MLIARQLERRSHFKGFFNLTSRLLGSGGELKAAKHVIPLLLQ